MTYKIPDEFADIFGLNDEVPIDVQIRIRDAASGQIPQASAEPEMSVDDILTLLYGEDFVTDMRKAEQQERLRKLLSVVDEFQDVALADSFGRFLRGKLMS